MSVRFGVVLSVVTAALVGCSAFTPEVGAQRGDAADASATPADSGAVPTDAGTTADAADASPQTVVVLVAPNGAHVFAPADVTIGVGDTVRWEWQTSGHTVTSGAGTADDRFCSPSDTNCANAPTSDVGAVYEHTFTTAGSYPYFCRPHRPMMSGTVTVR